MIRISNYVPDPRRTPTSSEGTCGIRPLLRGQTFNKRRAVLRKTTWRQEHWISQKGNNSIILSTVKHTSILLASTVLIRQRDCNLRMYGCVDSWRPRDMPQFLRCAVHAELLLWKAMHAAISLASNRVTCLSVSHLKPPRTLLNKSYPICVSVKDTSRKRLTGRIPNNVPDPRRTPTLSESISGVRQLFRGQILNRRRSVLRETTWRQVTRIHLKLQSFPTDFLCLVWYNSENDYSL